MVNKDEYTLCLEKRYHLTTNENFNNHCPIPVILVQMLVSEYAIE